MTGLKRSLPTLEEAPPYKKSKLNSVVENSENIPRPQDELQKKDELQKQDELQKYVNIFKDELKKQLNTSFVINLKEHQDLVPSEFKRPTNFDWKNPSNHYKYQSNHDGGKSAVNVHLIALSAKKEIWYAGAWFVLLPNWLNAHFDIKSSILFGHIRKIWGIRNRRKIRDRGQDFVRVIEKLKDLFNVYIMCKIGNEHLNRPSCLVESKESVIFILEAIQNIIFNQIIDSSIQTVAYQIKTENPMGCSSLNTENFKEISDTFNDITGESLVFMENWLRSDSLKETEFSQTLLHLINFLKNNDLQGFLNAFALVGEKDFIAEINGEKENTEVIDNVVAENISNLNKDTQHRPRL